MESDCYTDVVEWIYNQSITITITRESSARDDTRFFTEVHLLPNKLVLFVAIHPLDESRANWQSKAKPSVGAAHALTRWDLVAFDSRDDHDFPS